MRKLLYIALSVLLTVSCSNNEMINGKDGKNGSNGADGADGLKGKDGLSTSLILFGGVTNEEAKEILAKCPKRIYEVRIDNTTNLTEVDLSVLEEVNHIVIQNNKILSKVNFSDLTNIVYGVKVMYNTSLKNIDFKALKTIQGEIAVISDNPLLEKINLSNLEKQDCQITIANNDKLTEVNLSKLNNAKKAINLRANAAIVSFKMDLLKKAFKIEVQANPKLTKFEVPVLEEVTDLFNINTNGITKINFPELLKVGNSFKFIDNDELIEIKLAKLTDITLNKPGNFAQGFAFDRNNKMQILELPALKKSTNSNIRFSENKVLKTVNIPLLQESGNIQFSSNPELVNVYFNSLTSLPLNKNKYRTSFRTMFNPKITNINLSKLTKFGSIEIGENKNTTLIKTTETLLQNFIDNNVSKSSIRLTFKGTKTDKIIKLIKKLKVKQNTFLVNINK